MGKPCPVCRKPAFGELPGPVWTCTACGFMRCETAKPRAAAGGFAEWLRDVLTSRPETSVPALLEIGCGSGDNLELARDFGFEVMGVESNPELRAQSKNRLPGVFITESVENLPPHAFGFVLMSQVLEETDDFYTPFYALFRAIAINAKTIVLAQVAELDQAKPAYNNFTAPALAALFGLLNFETCEIEEAETQDGARALRLLAQGSDFVHFMQERYVPGTWSELTEYEHKPRYGYASRLTSGQNVLDFGCGTGYGARFLAETAQSVLAVDIDETALNYAKSSHQADNLKFVRNADLAASLGAEQFDLITCFEVIEHITATQQKELLNNFQRLLKPDGILLISTPNPAVTALYGDNPYHLHEMQHDEFTALLREIFPHVQMFRQNISASIFIQAEELEADKLSPIVLDDQVFPGQANTAIYLAACAKARRTELPSALYQDRTRDFIAGHIEMLRQRNWLALERLKIVRQEAEIQTLRSTLSTVNARLQEMDHLSVELDFASRAHEAEARNAELSERLQQIETSISWRALRRAQPILATLRPVLRPPLRLAYRAYRRFNGIASVPSPSTLPRNLALEMRLEPVWNETANCYELNCDKQAPRQDQNGWVKPYHVVPFHKAEAAEKRVLHVIPNVFVGGSTQLVIDLAQSLPRPFTHEIMPAALWQGGTHTGINVHHVPAPDHAAMKRVLDKVRPDLVHVHYWGLGDEAWYQAVLAALRGRALAVVQNVNTPIIPLVDPVFGAYVFVSQYVLDRFGAAAKASGAAVEVIHPGIDLKLFASQDAAPDAENAIGMVYRLERDKLNETSIDLLIEVVKRRPRTRAYVVGGGSLLQPYLERTEQAGVRENFRFTGYVPYEDLPGWYERFRVFIAPVWKESFGQVAPFAMSKGCAVSGYDIGALAEILGDHGMLGRNIEEATSIILELLDNPDRLARLGEENHRRAQTLFGLQKMMERYAGVYDTILKG